ncbi:hypothetical protein P7K49_012031 [Saguinus oedipus]|uniref:Uncharacterized protein n=1 Tax=Saguinus oedipus TaxID=9490 RepID=A0ABQ9VTW5_SAGOE|nr:hypothetical protein P7K49_012031 [Saguinus oedipus]
MHPPTPCPTATRAVLHPTGSLPGITRAEDEELQEPGFRQFLVTQLDAFIAVNVDASKCRTFRDGKWQHHTSSVHPISPSCFQFRLDRFLEVDVLNYVHVSDLYM